MITSNLRNTDIDKTNGYLSNLVDIPTDYIAYYKLDNDATDETGTYDGTATNVTYSTDRVGIANSVGVFNGTTSYIQLPVITYPNYFSVSAWFKSTATTDTIIANYGNSLDIGWLLTTTAFDCRTGNNVYSTLPYSGGTDGKWHNVVAVTADKYRAVYLDGKLVAEQTLPYTTVTYNNTNGTRIGMIVPPNPPLYFSGKADDIRIYDYVLSTKEIEALSLEKTCIAHYPFKGNVLDVSGNANHCTVVGTVNDVTDRFGYSTKAKQGDGTTGSIKPPTNASIDIVLNNTHTICGWLKNGSENACVLLQRASLIFGGYDGGFLYSIINSTTFNIRRAFGSSNVTNNIDLSSIGVDPAQWNFYCVAYNKITGYLTAYINGRRVLYANYTTNNVYVSNPTYDQGYHIISHIRNHTSDNYLDGYAKDVYLFNRILTQNEVMNLYLEKPDAS